MSWIDCVVNDDYEIFTEFPYSIREKSTGEIVDEKNYFNLVERLNRQDVFIELLEAEIYLELITN